MKVEGFLSQISKSKFDCNVTDIHVRIKEWKCKINYYRIIVSSGKV